MSGGRATIAAIEAEYGRYKAYAGSAFSQLTGGELNAQANPEANSIAMIIWHMSGNFASRFTDFLTTDGEKPWRNREEEFAQRTVSKPACMAKWEAGWQVLTDALAALTDADLDRMVQIRNQPLSVRDALLRSLAHASYHVGQIVYIAKVIRGPGWSYLTIPPGQSDAYNRDPKFDKPDAYAARIPGS